MINAVTVLHILKKKGSAVWSIPPDENTYRALEIMAEKDIGALLVVEDDQVVGLFSERDYARKVILKGKHSKDISVTEIMTKDVISIPPDTTTFHTLELMTNKRVRHLPVLEDGKLIGLISIGDVVQAIINELKASVQQLEQYISSGGG
ncbi:MAG: CBS domain-containing protein [Gammaproteobacteria bacterium]|nr:CBS domain-containing protein [Gammaproteobacteria bacterium]NNJ97578.1 CBS domain-containing protein [Gammaproteobacteria bacterium]